MTKNEFLNQLRIALSELKGEKERYVSDYSEIIDDKVEGGMSEEDAVASLGSPYEVAEKIKSEVVDDKPQNKLTTTNIVLLIVGFPLWFSLLCAAGAIILAVYASIWAVLVALCAVEIAFGITSVVLIIGGIITLFTNPWTGVLLFGAAFILCGVSALCFKPLIAFIEYLSKLTAKATIKLKNYCVDLFNRIISKNTYKSNVSNTATTNNVKTSTNIVNKKFLPKTVLYSALGSILLGCLLFAGSSAMVGFDYTKLSTVDKPEDVKAQVFLVGEEAVSIEEIKIDCKSNEVKIGVSEDSSIHLDYYKTEHENFELTTDGGVLSLIHTDNRKWYQKITVDLNFKDKEVTVLIPENYSGDFELNCGTGNVELNNYQNENAELSILMSTGNVKIDSIEAKNISLELTTGAVTINNSSVNALDIKVTSGAIFVTDTNVDTLIYTATTGHTSLKNVVASTEIKGNSSTGDTKLENVNSFKINVETSTGIIELKKLKGKTIRLKTTTGDIEGTILGSETDYIISSRTTTGSNNLPTEFGNGENTLTAICTTGNIEINFVNA